MDGGLRGAADGGHGRDQRSPPGRAPRNLRDVEGQATSEERDDYRQFVLTLVSEVGSAHREHGQRVSPVEAQAIQQITAALGTTGS
jgi:hypothetical protein